jgi:glyoxylase-like metal-dependent hydrolase (beta-lactamase superfamily II)
MSFSVLSPLVGNFHVETAAFTRNKNMNRFLSLALAKAPLSLVIMVCCAGFAFAEPVPGSLPAQWNAGAENCAVSPQPLLQVHAYEPQTFILRQSPCVNPEANFLYLLIGSRKALLIDTGAVTDPKKMPLGQTVLSLLPSKDGVRLPLLIVHTHKHRDHYAGDGQFASLQNVKVVPPDLASVRAFFGFDHWPEGITHLDLGDRIVDVIPTPGHESAHIAFYDERTALLLSGDFLMPGRLTLGDTAADQKSAARVIDFLANRPLAHILGGHIERDQAGHTYAEGATYHPNERPLELSREDLMKLPSALASFNGFYASHDDYSITQPMHNLLAVLCAAFALLSVAAFALYRLLLWRRRRRYRLALL